MMLTHWWLFQPVEDTLTQEKQNEGKGKTQPKSRRKLPSIPKDTPPASGPKKVKSKPKDSDGMQQIHNGKPKVPPRPSVSEKSSAALVKAKDTEMKQTDAKTDVSHTKPTVSPRTKISTVAGTAPEQKPTLTRSSSTEKPAVPPRPKITRQYSSEKKELRKQSSVNDKVSHKRKGVAERRELPKPDKSKATSKTMPSAKPSIVKDEKYGHVIPDWFKTLKTQLKDELKVAVAKRQMRLDEQRAQAEMDEITKRFESSQKAEAAESTAKQAHEAMTQAMKQFHEEKQQRYDIHGKITPPTTPTSSAPTVIITKPPVASKPALANRLSPQVSPRRTRSHRRQGSDPKISKFSPIKEDKKMEQELQTIEATTGLLNTSALAHSPIFPEMGRFKSDPTLHYSVTKEPDVTVFGLIGRRAQLDEYTASALDKMQRKLYEESMEQIDWLDYDTRKRDFHYMPFSFLQHSEDNLEKSEASLYQLLKNIETSPYNSEFSDIEDEDIAKREKKKSKIKAEIERRKRHIEEETRLHEELVRYQQNLEQEFSTNVTSHVRPRSQPLPSFSSPTTIVDIPLSSHSPTPHLAYRSSSPFVPRTQPLTSPISVGSANTSSGDYSGVWSPPHALFSAKPVPQVRSKTPDPKYTFMSIARPTAEVPTGIIKPLDDVLRHDEYTNKEYAMYKEHMERTGHTVGDSIHPEDIFAASSLTELSSYRPAVSRYDDSPTRVHYASYPSIALPSMPTSMHFPSSTMTTDVNGYHRPAPGMPYSRESGYSSMTYDNMGDYSPIITDVENSPSSDKTPAMPLLGDFTIKQRKRLEDLTGSAPLFEDLNFDSSGKFRP